MKDNTDKLDYKIKYLVTIIDAVHKKFEHLDGKSNQLERQYKNVEESQNKAAKVTTLLTTRLNDMSTNVINANLKNKNHKPNINQQELAKQYENVKMNQFETFQRDYLQSMTKNTDDSAIKKKRGRKKKEDIAENKQN